MTPDTPIRIAVIGSGPAGFYAAGHLLKDAGERMEVDMIERLPTPWGLVRSGVAPDHPKIKSVTRVYEKTAAHPRFRYFGNVTFGEHISREELLERYHAIVYATGSPSDRPLGIEGEDLPGSHAATEFVGWYNGHPDHTDLEVDLLSRGARGRDRQRQRRPRRRADARARARGARADRHRRPRARGARGQQGVGGRRGGTPRRRAGGFTNPELLELGELKDADVIVDAEELERGLAVEDEAAQEDVTARRNVEILRSYAEREPAGHRKRIVLRFLLSPVAFRANEQRTPRRDRARAQRARRLRRRRAAGEGHRRARDDRAPGSRSARSAIAASPLPGVPFDERSAVIPNDGGRVVEATGGQPLPGEYVVGWIKRGPSGVIGTNKKDAQETVTR